MPVYFISSGQIDQKKIEIGHDLAHHLQNVLRVKIGETLLFVDEQPKRYHAKVIESLPGRLVLEIEREEEAVRSGPMIRLGIALLKGEKMDWVFQKATELGVASIVPLLTKRVIARPKPDRFPHQRERWTKIIREAAQQSGRWDVPRIDLPSDLTPFLSDAAPGFKFIFYEAAPAGPLREKMKKTLDSFSAHSLSDRVGRPSKHGLEGTVLIGPEGGWDQSEVDLAVQKGYTVLSLGERTLRAETAALAALAIVQYEIEGSVERQDGSH